MNVRSISRKYTQEGHLLTRWGGNEKWGGTCKDKCVVFFQISAWSGRCFNLYSHVTRKQLITPNTLWHMFQQQKTSVMQITTSGSYFTGFISLCYSYLFPYLPESISLSLPLFRNIWLLLNIVSCFCWQLIIIHRINDEVIRSPPPICLFNLSAHLYPLSFELTDLWPWPLHVSRSWPWLAGDWRSRSWVRLMRSVLPRSRAGQFVL